MPEAGATSQSGAATRIQTHLICACLLADKPESGVARTEAVVPSSSYNQPSAVASSPSTITYPKPLLLPSAPSPAPSVVCHQDVSHPQMSASHPPARSSNPRRSPLLARHQRRHPPR